MGDELTREEAMDLVHLLRELEKMRDRSQGWVRENLQGAIDLIHKCLPDKWRLLL